MSWKIQLDKDWAREGFDFETVAGDDVEVSASERFSIETALVVVLTYVGSKVLDKLAGRVIDKGIDAAIKRLTNFARSKGKKLLLEIEDQKFDPRINLLAVKIESLEPAEFDAALDALPRLRVEATDLVDNITEDVADVWYVWQDNKWTFTNLTTKDGEVIEELPPKQRSEKT